MGIKYRTHVKDVGWQDKEFLNGDIAGTLGEAHALEFVELNFSEPIENLGVTYQVHVSNLGWQDPVSNGQMAGVLGEQIECIIIDLFGSEKDNYDIIYRSHVQDLGWLNWTKNGQKSGTEGGGKRLEALQIYMVPKDSVFFDVNQNFSCADLTPVTPPPAPSESEDSKRARIVATAQSYIGYVGNNRYSIFGDRYGDPYGDWCAYFDRSVYSDCGLSSLIPPTGYCPDAVDWFLDHATAQFRRRGNWIPKPGDLIYFDWDKNGVPNHTGLVEGSDGSTVTTIEGNTGSPAQVRRKYWNINDSDIMGYGIPDFS